MIATDRKRSLGPCLRRGDGNEAMRWRNRCEVATALPRCSLTGAERQAYPAMRVHYRPAVPKPRFHIRHLCRTYYLSEWWDE